LIGTGDNCFETALGQSAVADLSPAGSANRPAFANAKRWEVVIQHEFLAVLFTQTVDALFVADSSKRGCDQSLGFTAGEDSGAVRSRQNADLTSDIAQLPRIPAVDALAFEDQIAHNPLFQGLESSGDLLGSILGLAVFRQEFGGHAIAQL